MQLAKAEIDEGLQFTDAGTQIIMLDLKERSVDVGHGVGMAFSLQDARNFCLQCRNYIPESVPASGTQVNGN